MSAQTIVKPNIMGGFPVRLDWAQLPATRSMRPYFRSLGAFVVNDGKSVRISVHSPVGVLVPMVMVSVVAVLFMQGMHKRSFDVTVPIPTEVAPEAIADAQRKADALMAAVVAYHTATGKLPEGLADLTSTNPRTGSPYLSSIDLDPWGFGFIYTVTSASRAEFEIRSWGADGLPKTNDDVVAMGTITK